MGKSIGIGSISAISGLKCIGIGLVVKKRYRCITTGIINIAFHSTTIFLLVVRNCGGKPNFPSGMSLRIGLLSSSQLNR